MDKESKKLVALLKKAEVDEALKYAESMKGRKNASEILGDFAVSLIKNLHEYETAERLLKKAASINPKDAESYFNLGVLYTEPGFSLRSKSRMADAEKAYLKAIQIKPDYMEAHFNLALLYHFSGRSEEAELESAVFSELCRDTEISEALKRVLRKKIRKIDLKKYLQD